MKWNQQAERTIGWIESAYLNVRNLARAMDTDAHKAAQEDLSDIAGRSARGAFEAFGALEAGMKAQIVRRWDELPSFSAPADSGQSGAPGACSVTQPW
jgi:hypothetical protein